jgi:opacity protein-like surface antigen
MQTLLVLLAALVAAPAFADPALTIPAAPIDPNPSPSLWNGAYVGSGVTFAAAKGQKGQVGGDVFAGYDKTFANNFVIGVRFDTGYSPFLTPSGRFRGFDFAMGEVKLGYDFGRVSPYVFAGGGIARATNFSSPFPDAATAVNGAFGTGPGFGVATFGAGVDYHITNNITVGVQARVVNGAGGPGGGF